MFQKTTIDLRKSSLKIYFRFKKSQVAFFMICSKTCSKVQNNFRFIPIKKDLFSNRKITAFFEIH